MPLRAFSLLDIDSEARGEHRRATRGRADPRAPAIRRLIALICGAPVSRRDRPPAPSARRAPIVDQLDSRATTSAPSLARPVDIGSVNLESAGVPRTTSASRPPRQPGQRYRRPRAVAQRSLPSHLALHPVASKNGRAPAVSHAHRRASHRQHSRADPCARTASESRQALAASIRARARRGLRAPAPPRPPTPRNVARRACSPPLGRWLEASTSAARTTSRAPARPHQPPPRIVALSARARAGRPRYRAPIRRPHQPASTIRKPTRQMPSDQSAAQTDPCPALASWIALDAAAGAEGGAAADADGK